MRVCSFSPRGWLAVAAALAMATGCNPGRVGPRRDGGTGDGATTANQPDADGDGIWDSWEGRADMVDTDGDGTPDYLDLDSDGDGIPDSVEGRPSPGTGEPIDSDGDGIYDFRDTDSDGNGIPDMDEPDTDMDMDGLQAYCDTDDDGDRILDVEEIGGNPDAPLDTDGDGMFDYQDIDSDADTIGDLSESTVDTDGDGTPDRFDQDSDNDTWTDAEEAGDTDVATPPIDSDGDGIPNFRDTDSDDDGLSDADERTYGTDPTNPDTDGDGVSDLVEIAACPAGDTSCAMDATNPTSNPRTRGDFVFLEPYMMPPTPPRDTLDFATNIRQADVYFLIDSTGSMGGAIDNVKLGLSAPSTGIIDQVRATIPDTYFGVGDFKDAGDVYVYRNVTDMTASASTAQAGVNTLSASGGGDTPEGDVPSLYAAASGMGVSTSPAIAARTGCPAGTFGYPCFRSGAVPIIIADYRRTFPQRPREWKSERLHVLRDGAFGADLEPRPRHRDVGRVSGWHGRPAADGARYGRRGRVREPPRERDQRREHRQLRRRVADPDAGEQHLVRHLGHVRGRPVGHRSTPGRRSSTTSRPTRPATARAAVLPGSAIDTDGDGYNDTFPGVTAGERVCFDIIVKQNDTVMPTACAAALPGHAARAR